MRWLPAVPSQCDSSRLERREGEELPMMMTMMKGDEPYHIHIRLGTTPARVRIYNTISYYIRRLDA